MIMNIKALAFTSLDDVTKRFEIMKNCFQKYGGNYKEFFGYFERTWLDGTKFKKELWNYSLAVFLYKIFQNLKYTYLNIFLLID